MTTLRGDDHKSSTLRRKERLVDKILQNPTYKPESGLVQQLRKHLLKLPVIALGQLDLIIVQKVGS